MMDFFKIYTEDDERIIEDGLKLALTRLRTIGPSEPDVLEFLSHAKDAAPDIFSRYENEILMAMGLFYKPSEPTSLYAVVYDAYREEIRKRYAAALTPVQVNMLSNIERTESFSFSAPTSAGKSHALRRLIENATASVVVVLPSRALIYEYVNTLSTALGNDVLILQFVEKVNLKKSKKCVYVITPERGTGLFSKFTDAEISLFIFDEAQLSDDVSRGYLFDAFVINVYNNFPHAKKIFTHPFIKNPEAQLTKYGKICDTSASQNYLQQSVGKIYVASEEKKGDNVFSFFSPYRVGLKDSYELDYDVVARSIESKRMVLIYTSKAAIISQRVVKSYAKYVNMCKNIEDEKAISIINKVEEYIGSDSKDPERQSLLVDYMRKGIVFHHGSMPLRIRSLVELFVRGGFARICFATSTLSQGINMPFYVVWIDYFRFVESDENSRALSLKNLIGRAGRSTDEASFDYGFVIVPKKNLAKFKNRIKIEPTIRDKAPLLEDEDKIPEDFRELAKSINDGTFDSEYNLPNSQINRLTLPKAVDAINKLLPLVFIDDQLMTPKQYYESDLKIIDGIKASMHAILEEYAGRPLSKGEKVVLSESIPIFLARVHGHSLKSVVSSRFANARKRQKNKKTLFVPRAARLPQKNLTAVDLFKTSQKVDYDTFVYDTYDYLDKVIGLSLSGPLCAAFNKYFMRTLDSRADKFSKFIQYGTAKQEEIMLIRYGFYLEDIEWILPCVEHVDDNEIIFNHKVDELNEEQRAILRNFID